MKIRHAAVLVTVLVALVFVATSASSCTTGELGAVPPLTRTPVNTITPVPSKTAVSAVPTNTPARTGELTYGRVNIDSANTSPALEVNQRSTGKILSVKDASTEVARIPDGGDIETNGKVRIGWSGTPSATQAANSVYVKGAVEVDGELRADGGIVGSISNDMDGGNLILDPNQSTALRAQTNGLATFTLPATGTLQITTGNFRVGNGSNDVSLNGEDLYCEGTSEFDSAMRVDSTLAVKSSSATAFTAGLNGSTNPAFTIDASTGSQAAGFKVTGAATGGTVALACTDSGSNTNLTIDAKGSGTIGIGGTSTGAITLGRATTISGALTPSAGIGSPNATTRVVKPYGIDTLGQMAYVSTYGTEANNVNTEAYCASIFVPANLSTTGVSIFNGSAAAGNVKAYLFTSDGTAALAATASTAASGTDAYQRIAWSGGPVSIVGPATDYICVTADTSGATEKMNFHTLGEGEAWKETGATYGTLASITPPGTFTTTLGPVASLY